MIIVSQDKDGILNFDNVIGIIIAIDIESNKKTRIAIDTIEGERYYIARYSTEERAKEVLQEIINYASVSKINDNYQVADLRLKLAKMCRYEMPKE